MCYCVQVDDLCLIIMFNLLQNFLLIDILISPFNSL